MDLASGMLVAEQISMQHAKPWQVLLLSLSKALYCMAGDLWEGTRKKRGTSVESPKGAGNL